MLVTIGARLRSTVCTTEVVVVRAAGQVSLQCGGAPMVALTDPVEATGEPDPRFAAGTQLGKRYVSEHCGLDVMCTRPGAGSLAVDGEPMILAQAKALPASD